MVDLPKLSVRLHGGLTASECAAQARATEAAGLHGVWFAENPFHRGILPAATACALATRTLRIGAGVFNPYTRHPVQIAMDVGALDEMAEGRVCLGLGSGIGSAIEQIGFAYDRPLTILREAIAIVRGLLSGEAVTYAGTVFNVRDVRLAYRTRGDIPIYMTGRGRQSIMACGEIADGLIVSNMCTAAFVAGTVKALHDAARAAGRSRVPGVVQYMPCIPRADRTEALRLGRRAVAEMLPAFWTLANRLPSAKQALLGGGLTDDDFAAAFARLKAGEPPERALDDRFVAAFAIAGDRDDCRRQIEACGAAGVTELALTFFGPHPADEMNYLTSVIATAA